MSGEIRLVFLGGVGEIGMNCLAVETERGTVIIDCGVMFPPGQHFGPDFIIPDIRYFEVNRDNIMAVLITHGHEDHIGAVPAIFGDTGVPVYAPPFAASLLKAKALEYPGPPSLPVNQIRPGDELELAGLGFRFIRVTHSIPDALAIAITTPYGTILHTGDFRVDEAPSIGEPMDLPAFAELGDEGVLLMLSDSTNVERSGTTRPESEVVADVAKLVANHKGRVLMSLFSSNMERVTLLAQMANRLGRRLGLVGRSLYSYGRAAMETGLRPFDPNDLVDPKFADEVEGGRLMLMVAGSQGESRSALTRISTGEHADVHIRDDDLVIYSSKIIPGNEKGIQAVANNLIRLGATVFDETNADIHTSGHAPGEDLARVLKLVRPKYFVPVHGEYRFLESHARLAEETVGAEAVIADLGDMLTVSARGVEHAGSLDLEECYIEGPLMGNAEDLKLRDRRRLLHNGLVIVRCTFKKRTRGVELRPEITLHGVPDPDGSLVDAMERSIINDFDNQLRGGSEKSIEEEVRILARRVVKKRQGRKPVVQVFLQSA